MASGRLSARRGAACYAPTRHGETAGSPKSAFDLRRSFLVARSHAERQHDI